MIRVTNKGTLRMKGDTINNYSRTTGANQEGLKHQELTVTSVRFSN